MDGTIVYVPVHLDAYLAEEDTPSVLSSADFSKLPYVDPDVGDINPDHPYISDSIVSEPFESQHGVLKKGLHLHWSLPDYLTRGSYLDDANDGQQHPVYPEVPTNWLVTRKKEGEPTQQWIVQSDYLHPEGNDNLYNAITYPVEVPSGQPFRYLGRQLPIDQWDVAEAVDKLSSLTALGYGDPAFAAFYPNCHSVFGFFDESISVKEDLEGLSYEVLGWYTESAKDPVVSMKTSYDNGTVTAKGSDSTEKINSILEDHFGWKVELDTDEWPQGMVCFAELDFSPEADINNSAEKAPVSVSVGNSGTEALAAFLSQQKDTTNPLKFEEQLERLQLQEDLKGLELDMGHRFRQARHRKGFKPGYGPDLYVLKEKALDPEQDRQSQQKRFVPAQIRLPSDLSGQLDELNEAKKVLDTLRNTLARQRHLLFADWYKYQLSAYPDAQVQDQYPDTDEIRFHMEHDTMANMASMAEEIALKNGEIEANEDSLKALLQKELEKFNSGTSQKEVGTFLFHEQRILESKLKFHGNSEALWVENEPFSLQCLYFHRNYLSIENKQTGLQGISLWVNVASGNHALATLLYTEAPLRKFSKQGVNNFWGRVVINRHEQTVTREVTWNSLPKDQWTYLYLEFRRPMQPGEVLHLFGYDEHTTLKGRLAGIRFFTEGLSPEELDYDRNMLGHAQYQLEATPGARFWEPTEPVLLLEGEAVEPSLRHGHDGLHDESAYLYCPTRMAGEGVAMSATSSQALLQEVLEEVRGNEADASPGQLKTGHWKWRQQPWHPLFMEWETRFFPTTEGSNIYSDNRQYDQDFITKNYQLNRDEPELTLKRKGVDFHHGSLYSGRSILTPYAKRQFQQTAIKTLKHISLSAVATAREETDKMQVWLNEKPELSDWYPNHEAQYQDLERFKDWYHDKPSQESETDDFKGLTEAEQAKDFYYSLINFLMEVTHAHCISQALSGFNAALLMHHHRLQIPIADPLGFDEQRAFAAEVSNQLTGYTRWGCTPRSAFHPIRSGVLRLEKLHLIDTFGRKKEDIDLQQLIKAEPVTLPSNQSHQSNDFWLSPRLVQPSRIDFRWLDAGTENSEMNSHPDSGPIIGWVLCNHMDESLMIYDRHGEGLGWIAADTTWQALPGNDKPEDFQNIDDHLTAVLEKICITGNSGEEEANNRKSYLKSFTAAIDRAIAFIEPESSVFDDGLAHLLGHPIAITRAFVQLKLDKPPVVDHSWLAFHHYLEGGDRMTDAFDKVDIPIRIGESDRLNDGVVGYWLETEGTLGNTFYAMAEEVQAVDAGSESIRPYDVDRPNLLLKPGGERQEMTLLMDPRGKVHAISGILPVKTIDLPDQQFMEALKKVSTGMFQTRILTPKEKWQLPIRHESGHEWVWLEKDRFQWTEKSEHGIVEKATLMSTFPSGDQLWQHLQEQDWIHLTSAYRAEIVASDERRSQQLEAPFTAISGQVQRWLDQCELLGSSAEARFYSQSLIREGWLKLQVDQLGNSEDTVLYGGVEIVEEVWKDQSYIDSAHLLGDFGSSVALSDDWLMIGGGVKEATGIVVIYQKANGTWQSYTELKTDDGDNRVTFGTKVFINQNWAFVSTPNYHSPNHQYLYQLRQSEGAKKGTWRWEVPRKDVFEGLSWVDHISISKDWMLAAGAVEGGIMGYQFYQYLNNQWKTIPELGKSGPEYHGLQVAVTGNWALIGVPADASKGANSGSAIMLRFKSGQWEEHSPLSGDDSHVAGSYFGYQVVLGAEWAIVGSPFSQATNGEKTGAVYAYQLIDNEWVLRQTLQPGDLKDKARFGAGLQMDQDRLMIQTAEASGGGHAIYHYQLESGIWVQAQKIYERDLSYQSMAMHGKEIAVGSRKENEPGRVRLLHLVEQEENNEN